MHEEQMRDLYYNVKFNKDGRIITQVGERTRQMNNEILEEILKVPIEGIRSMVGKDCTKIFANEWSKLQ